METWKIANGCYGAELTVHNDGHMSLGVTCSAAPPGQPAGQYVRLDFGQAVSLCRFLLDRVPGVVEAIGPEGTEV